MNINNIDPHGRTLYADSVLNVIVTGYRGVHADNIVTYPDGLPAWFNLGKMLLNEPPQDVAALQAAIRSETDPERRDALKRGMLAITPAAFVTPPRKAANVQYLTGLMPFDIDAKDNAGRLVNYDTLKAEISKIPYVAYCGRSVSGKGFWGLLFIGYSVTAPEYKAAFKAMQEDFEDMGIIIDPAPANPASLRFYSFDPEGYVNHYPEAYTRRYIAPPAPKPEPKRYTATTMRNGEASQSIFAQFNQASDICTMLEHYGWKPAGKDGEGVRYVRPGKQSGKGAWAHPAKNFCYIWTSSTPLEPNEVYTPAALYTLMEFGGIDKHHWREAARALRAQM